MPALVLCQDWECWCLQGHAGEGLEPQKRGRDVPAALGALEGRCCSEQHVLLHVAPTRPISSLSGCREEGKLLAWAQNRQSHVAQEESQARAHLVSEEI